ncbi:hypothetical protein CERZMDRAFT_103199 [Cercospora zeae-maydis SCOH1-5]|uniref:Uncharacterized protein n=1 Tax=Cercospora zeae-maydis SCOH1-5 TaxID=717836 RepID=A0A6A6EWP9_9PEZI|nr:hypothetical protein CERZMDRAFT_103199 [Cercospora zeae-maydis SCOH1-5]
MPASTRKKGIAKVTKNRALPSRRPNAFQTQPAARGKAFAPSRGQRGKTSGCGDYQRPHAHHDEAAKDRALPSEQIIASAHPDPKDAPGTFKVARVFTELFETKPTALNFVAQGNLQTSPDVETMTLNLMDFCLLEENWNPALSHNKLAASCFYFASRVVEPSATIAAEDVAKAFEHEAEMSANAWMMWVTKSGGGSSQPHGAVMSGDIELREKARSACQVSAEDVALGFAILWQMRDRLGDVVGAYRDALMHLPAPGLENAQEGVSLLAEQQVNRDGQEPHVASTFSEVSWKSGANQDGSDLPSLEPENPELVELDDFEFSVEGFAS